MYSTKMLPHCNRCQCDIQKCQIMSTFDPVCLFFVDEVQHSDVLQRMGGGSSSYADLPKNEHLNRLVSKVTLNKFDTTNTKLFLLTLINHAGSAVSQ